MTAPYEILGISPDATPEEAKAAYRKLAKKHHPDLNPDDPEAQNRFQEINTAYEAFVNPTGPHLHQHQHHHNQHDFFQEFVRRAHEASMRAQNHDIRVLAQITIKQAFDGCDAEVHTPNGPRRVAIPAGIRDGEQVRVAGAGMKRFEQYPPGDLYIVVQILDDENFTHVGTDLLTRIRINSLEAIAGKTATITGVDGAVIDVTIPPGTQFGDRIRIEGHGMPVYGEGGKRAALLCEVVIETPALEGEALEMAKEILQLVNQNR